jgi:hypothetical protein
MAKGPEAALGRNIRELSRGLADAPDAQVARVVAVVDQMPSRGDADQLIAPLRPRLARLRPPRPLRFTRLLFLPLEPLIVPPQRWRPNMPAIPRSALTSLAATVRAGLGAEAARVDALIQAASSHDAETIAQAGAVLWPRAAAVLFAAGAPVEWAATGLNPSLYPPLAQRTGAVMAQALALEDLVAEAAVGIVPPRPAPIRAMLEDVCARCPDACPMLATVLLGRLPQCAALLPAMAAELGPQVEAAFRLAGQEAAEALLSGLEAAGGAEYAVGGHDLAEAVQEVRRTAALLKQLADRTDLPQLHVRLQSVRQRFDMGCRQVFAQAMTAEFLPALTRADGKGGALEATARHLRELESDARPLGGGDTYDSQLRQAAAAVAADASLSLTARVRLVEILAGAEAALALLNRGA